MADLLATEACAGLGLRVARGGTTLAAWDPGPIAAIAPYAAGTAATAAALAPFGLAWPDPGRMTTNGAARLAFAGRGTCFLIGVAPPSLGAAAAVTDQSDGWAGLCLTGAAAPDVLARLVAIDLRPAALPPGSAVRAMLNHMPLCLMRTEGAFELLVFRSMARTAVHDLTEAMIRVAARR
ncbi:MAG: sarcosine oxidase subunit gamma [Gemmobacter sp.]